MERESVRMETVISPETSAKLCHTTRHHIPGHNNLHTHRRQIWLCKESPLLILWSMLIHENPKAAKSNMKFPSFGETRRYITVFTKSCHCILSWARWIPFTKSHTITVSCSFILFYHHNETVEYLEIMHEKLNLNETCKTKGRRCLGYLEKKHKLTWEIS